MTFLTLALMVVMKALIERLHFKQKCVFVRPQWSSFDGQTILCLHYSWRDNMFISNRTMQQKDALQFCSVVSLQDSFYQRGQGSDRKDVCWGKFKKNFFLNNNREGQRTERNDRKQWPSVTWTFLKPFAKTFLVSSTSSGGRRLHSVPQDGRVIRCFTYYLH